MLGLITDISKETVAREFFELFKTPWEFFVDGREYDVVLCVGNLAEVGKISTKLLVIYASEETALDSRVGIGKFQYGQGGDICFGGFSIPLYQGVLRFECESGRSANSATTGSVVKFQNPRIVRLGYDLFDEIQSLLSQGQPAAHAATPSLDLHIALLRRVITSAGLTLAEVPPVPAGASFIACLTHDIDHASIRRHKFDATMFGFLYRATVGSVAKTAGRRLPLMKLFANWIAVVKLPFVHVGLARDFWYDFDRYVEIENGRSSTFFVIPFARTPGRSESGDAPAARGAGYGVSDIAEKIRDLRKRGSEIGLHGINAWIDDSDGREEARSVSEASGAPAEGVRMHWLYFSEGSPSLIEEAGFSYDSTVGYNETIGYRAGTSQVFKPLSATELLELPLNVMDTALFYPDYLNLTEDEARKRIVPLLQNAKREGGVLTINWHDRSIAPERLWDDCYKQLLEDLTESGAMFLTASQAVSWFRKRRSVVFQDTGRELRARVSSPEASSAPLRLRLHKCEATANTLDEIENANESYTDQVFAEDVRLEHEPHEAGISAARYI